MNLYKEPAIDVLNAMKQVTPDINEHGDYSFWGGTQWLCQPDNEEDDEYIIYSRSGMDRWNLTTSGDIVFCQRPKDQRSSLVKKLGFKIS